MLLYSKANDGGSFWSWREGGRRREPKEGMVAVTREVNFSLEGVYT